MHNSVLIVSPDQRKGSYGSSEINMPHIKVEPDEDYKYKQEMRNSVLVNNGLVKSNHNNNNNNNNNDNLMKCKRRINFTYSSMPGQQPASVARRNARERNRVKQVNNGFATLRSHIPLSVAAAMTSNAEAVASRTASKKLSKVETLRMAVEYIRSLQDMLDDSEGGRSTSHLDDSYYRNLKQIDSMSEASTSPPPSSYASESSYVTPPSDTHNNNNNYPDNYDSMSPEDEELLDVISWWQQSQ